MKKLSFFPLLAVFSMLMISLSGCEVVGGIFKAGVWAGVIIVVVVIGIILWLLRKIF